MATVYLEDKILGKVISASNCKELASKSRLSLSMIRKLSSGERDSKDFKLWWKDGIKATQ